MPRIAKCYATEDDWASSKLSYRTAPDQIIKSKALREFKPPAEGFHFLQGVSRACYAEPCISYDRIVCLSFCLSIRLSHAGIE